MHWGSLEVLDGRIAIQYLHRPHARRRGKSSAVRAFDVADTTRTDDPWRMSLRRHIVDPIPPLKEQLARELVARVAGWTQEYAAAFIGTDQPRMSDLRKGRLGRFSLEK